LWKEIQVSIKREGWPVEVTWASRSLGHRIFGDWSSPVFGAQKRQESSSSVS
jgi:hypothetical protein